MDIESWKNKFVTHFYRSPSFVCFPTKEVAGMVHVPANESGQATEPTFWSPGEKCGGKHYKYGQNRHLQTQAHGQTPRLGPLSLVPPGESNLWFVWHTVREESINIFLFSNSYVFIQKMARLAFFCEVTQKIPKTQLVKWSKILMKPTLTLQRVTNTRDQHSMTGWDEAAVTLFWS